MLPDGSLPGDFKRELVGLLVDAFPAPANLDALTQFYLDRRLPSLTAGGDQPTLVLAVVNWCETARGDTLARLLRGAVEQQPHRADLRALAARLGVPPPDPPPAPPAPAPGAAFEDTIVQTVADELAQARAQGPPPTMASLLKNLDQLLNRKTFRQPMPECEDQDWKTRLHKAYQTHRLLQGQLSPMVAACATAAQWAGYQDLVYAASQYCQTMGVRLFQPSVQEGEVAPVIGTARFGALWPADRARHFAPDAAALAACEQRRQAVWTAYSALQQSVPPAAPA
jgi:hypothetical protein